MIETIEKIRSRAIDFNVDVDWAIHKKKEYIADQLKIMADQKKLLGKHLINPRLNKVERELIFLSLDDIKKLEKDLTQYSYLLGSKMKDFKITDEMIRAAKEYPIEKLVEVHKGKALCINHKDTNPSMDCRKNFAHCYVCDESWDTIDIVMRLQGKPFNEAVRYLND